MSSHDEADRLMAEAEDNPPRHRGYAWHSEPEGNYGDTWLEHFAIHESGTHSVWITRTVRGWQDFCDAVDGYLDHGKGFYMERKN